MKGMKKEFMQEKKLFDDDLENDELSLEEWGFWQGYFAEEDF
jgi:hypothetical protein